MDKNTILKAVIDYNNSDPSYVRFHMPGHKGRGIGLPFDDALGYDLTEIPQTGNLLDPDDGDVTDVTLDYITRLYGTAASVMTAGGATSALQAAILASLRKSTSRRIYCYRHIHRSAVNAMALCGADVVWLSDGTYPTDTAAAMLVTSPDYYGRTLDLRKIADECARYAIPLIVDGAHGPHLAFYDGGTLHPTKLGAALTVDSLHKTLPALTGSAMLHSMPYAGGTFTRDELLSAMRTFTSTSPSYLIQCSMVRCMEYMEENGRERLDRLYELLFDVKARIRALGFEVPDCGDPFRLVIRDRNAPVIESELAADNVIVEFADADNVVLIPSVMTDSTDMNRLVSSLERTVKNGFVPKSPDSDSSLPQYSEAVMSLREAVMAANEVIPIKKSIGRICAEAVTPYPPGVPVVMPGEVITQEAVDFAYRRGVDTVRVTI